MRSSTTGLVYLIALVQFSTAQEAPQFAPTELLTNREVVLEISAPLDRTFRIETSPDLVEWVGLATFLSTSSNQHTDSAAPFLTRRFYRAREAAESDVVTGDHFLTADGEFTFHPINHATFLMTWHGQTIYCDPVGGAARFQGLPRADLILVTHGHDDHYDAASIRAVKGTNGMILASLGVYQSLPNDLKPLATVLTNGARTNLLNLSVQAVPAYNLTSSFHPKGTGNGYVLTAGGKRIYVSGDTEDTPELRALQGIDVAFVCMNLPYTMSVAKAADAVRQFQPKVVYVYHTRGYASTDVSRFKHLVGTDRNIEVRLRKWY